MEVIITKKYGGFLMSQIGRLSGRTWERLLKECGVDAFNGAQGRILYVLWEHEKLTITDIARLTSLAKTTLTSMLDRMEASGLLKRIPDKNNRRQVFICITEEAKKYREKYNKLSDDMNEIFYDGFTETEISEFENKLRRILENFEKEGI
ncbi:MAG: MarR family transcriptional regulator [Defluviitaleaceae bacterium]|nr:MarR family transcriptional regulator [Defluviitaleaceae bacterium]